MMKSSHYYCDFNFRNNFINIALILLCVFSGVLSAEEIKNGGFESSLTGWSMFDPGNAKAQGSLITSTDADKREGSFSGALDSPTPQRYSLSQSVKIVPKGKYRVVAWVKAAPDAVLQGGAPGVYLRVIFSTAEWKEASADAQMIGLSGTIAGRKSGQDKLGNGTLPKDWTKLQLEVVAPDDAANMGIDLFSHGVTGRVYWDSVSIEKL